MNKANYRKGKRQEIIKLLHYCGTIPYSAINYMEQNKKSRMYHAIINKMQKEGIVRIEKCNGEKQLVLNKYDEMSSLYARAIDSEYQNFYLNTGEQIRKVAMFQDKRDAGKILRTNEMIVMMYSVGIKTLLDEKENLSRCEMLPVDTNMYFTSREVKRGAGYGDMVEYETQSPTATPTPDVNKQQKTVIGSRMDGLLVSNGGIYIVYNIRNQNYLWKPQGELRIKLFVERLINKIHPRHYKEKRYECNDAIIFSTQQSRFAKMLSENGRNDSFKKMIGLGTLYKNIYALPSNTNGKRMLEIMTNANWKQNMLNDMLSEEALKEGEYTTVTCDGYDKENDIYKLLFCIPNLAKLYTYASRAKMENAPDKFEVYCFDFQTPLVVAVTEGKAKIKEIPLEEYYKHIREENE